MLKTAFVNMGAPIPTGKDIVFVYNFDQFIWQEAIIQIWLTLRVLWPRKTLGICDSKFSISQSLRSSKKKTGVKGEKIAY
jgi:hypothetical protein